MNLQVFTIADCVEVAVVELNIKSSMVRMALGDCPSVGPVAAITLHVFHFDALNVVSDSSGEDALRTKKVEPCDPRIAP